MVVSKSFKDLQTSEALAVLLSKTYYVGEKGQEIAYYSSTSNHISDRSHQVALPISTSFFYYGSGEA